MKVQSVVHASANVTVAFVIFPLYLTASLSKQVREKNGGKTLTRQ